MEAKNHGGTASANTTGKKNNNSAGSLNRFRFVFDEVFDQHTSQKEIFVNRVAPLVTDFVNTGCNATVFTYRKPIV